MPIDRFISKKARRDLAAALNSLLASPTFASWRQGATHDVATGSRREWPHQRDDRARVVEGMRLANGVDDVDYDAMLRQLPPRWFLIRNAHVAGAPQWVQPRWAITLMRGPMTRQEIRRARGGLRH